MTTPFTTEDFAARMRRAAGQAKDDGLTGVLVTPGPDLVYFTGYSPIAITEIVPSVDRTVRYLTGGDTPPASPTRRRRR